MNKKKIKKLIIILVIILICIYLIYTIYLLVKEPTNIFTVENGKVSQEETAIGYIIRDEQVVKGENYKNGIKQIKTEGEKTAKGESIFRYYSRNENDLINKISELDEKIQEVMSNQTNLFNFNSDVKLIENQIDEKVARLNQNTDINILNELKKEINELITKKANIIGEESPSGSYLKELINQRSSLENELNSGTEYIQAPESGIVSYKVDGLEEILTPDNFSSLTKEYLEGLNLKTGNIIATSDECGKIINNFECYIMTISSSKEAKNAKIGDKVKLRLSNNSEIDAEITYISQENEEELMLALKIDEQIAELTNYRKMSFTIIWWSYSGLKIPNQAIVNQDGLNYVVRNRAGYLNKILVKIENQNEKYAIVSSFDNDELRDLGFSDSEITSMRKLSVYDEILLNPDLSKVE